MPKKPKLNITQARIVKGKVDGKKQRDIGREVFPNATPESASVLVSRELKKVNVQEALHIALAKKGITPDKIAQRVAEGMDAEKIHSSPTEPDQVVPDHSIRLKATGMAANFMGIAKDKESGNTYIFNKGDVVQKYVRD